MGYCLEDLPSTEEPYSYPDLPPGALYNADHQCKLQFGSVSATVCSPLEEVNNLKLNLQMLIIINNFFLNK